MKKSPEPNISNLSSFQAEQSIIGAILLRPECLDDILETITIEHFVGLNHKAIFECILRLKKDNRLTEIVSLYEEFKHINRLDLFDICKTILKDVATTAHLQDHLAILNNKFIARQLNAIGEEIKAKVVDGEDVDDILTETEKEIYDIAQNRIKRDFIKASDAIQGTVDYISLIYDNKSGVTGLRTGFQKFDEYTCGLQKQDLIIIAGRPSAGKTAFAIDILRNITISQNVPGAVISLEMSTDQLLMRLISAESRIDNHRIRSGFISRDDWPPIYDSANRIKNSQLYIDDTPSLNIFELRSKARKIKNKFDIKVLIVDYLQLMSSGQKRESRQQEVAEISRALKQLAKELDIPIIALSQMSREIEHTNRKPRLADLRESGALEQDADVVCFIYREFQNTWELNGGDNRETSLIIAKQRQGATGIINLLFVPEWMSFVEEE